MELLPKPTIGDLTANFSPWLVRLFLKCTSGYLLLLYKVQWIPIVSKLTSKLLSCYTMLFTIWTWTCQPPFWPNLHESQCHPHRFSHFRMLNFYTCKILHAWFPQLIISPLNFCSFIKIPFCSGISFHINFFLDSSGKIKMSIFLIL